MSRQAKRLLTASAALVVLGAVLAALILTKPKPQPAESTAQDTSETSVIYPYIVDRRADEVLSVTVSNPAGSYTFTRQTRTLSETSGEEYYWTSAELKGVPPDDSVVRSFIANLASLPASRTVEENAADLAKYGLDTPKATAELRFDDGTGIKMRFGIQNPADSESVYFCDEDGKVSLVNYQAALPALSDVKRFAKLTLTEAYSSSENNELEYLGITRPDLEAPVEIRYMSELAELSGDDDHIISTFNTHRFTSPITAEVDAESGKSVCYGVYGLTMSACEYLEQTEENMKACGLDELRATVRFKYGGREYELKIGGVREAVRDEEGSVIYAAGYYAVLNGYSGIYSIAREKAPWVTLQINDVISRRPLSPYIYSVESVEVALPNGSFKFDIDGVSKLFSCGGKQLLGDEFRSYYQTLIGSVGEEIYTGEVSGTPIASVTFNYKSDYFDVYGKRSDTLSYYESDDRKCVVALNGTPIFKVRSVYVDRLAENTDALLNGGKVRVDF